MSSLCLANDGPATGFGCGTDRKGNLPFSSYSMEPSRGIAGMVQEKVLGKRKYTVTQL